MTLHLLRPAAGCPDLATLRQRHAQYAQPYQGRICPVAFTRSVPQRVEELLDGGSVYWVIKHLIQARNPLLAIDIDRDDDGRRFAILRFEPTLIPVRPIPRRAFQGWRYMAAGDAPPDADQDISADMPAEMVQELQKLGLL